jgi:hypothetical protein
MDQIESERSFEAEETGSTLADFHRNGEAGEGDDFMSVDELQQLGIGAVDIQKLKLAGICTVKVRLSGRKPHSSPPTKPPLLGNPHDLKTEPLQGKGPLRGKG